MIKISTIAAMMAVGSFMPQHALAKELARAKKEAAVTRQAFTANSPIVKQARIKASADNSMVGNMHKTNVINAVAMVLWHEARGKKEGVAGRKAVASVILNRSGNDPTCIIDVIKEKNAFSCIKSKYKGGWTDKTYQYFTPTTNEFNNAENVEIWKNCTDIALKLVNKEFTSTIGKRNAYLNKDTADQKAVDSWGEKCTMKIGSHYFGYLAEHDPKYVKPGTMTSWKKIPGGNPKAKKTATPKSDVAAKPEYVRLKYGDTLSKVAKAHKTTVNVLMQLNKGSIKNKNIVKAGMKIRIK